MTEIFNKQEFTKLRRKLRNRMPEPEIRLWQKLRARQVNGLKFRRQAGIGPYVVDFYCPAAKTVIEIDGHTHGTEIEKQRDGEKQLSIEKLGLRVLRYSNLDVMKNLEGVLEDIRVKTTPSPSFARRGISGDATPDSSSKTGDDS